MTTPQVLRAQGLTICAVDVAMLDFLTPRSGSTIRSRICDPALGRFRLSAEVDVGVGVMLSRMRLDRRHNAFLAAPDALEQVRGAGCVVMGARSGAKSHSLPTSITQQRS